MQTLLLLLSLLNLLLNVCILAFLLLKDKKTLIRTEVHDKALQMSEDMSVFSFGTAKAQVIKKETPIEEFLSQK